MNNPFDYSPDEECNRAFRDLSARLEILNESNNPDDISFIAELRAGKMLGVLIAEDDAGARHTLFAFSGQIGNGEFHRAGFVGPVFDYLLPDGYFKREEHEISLLNDEISRFETEVVAVREKEFRELEISLLSEAEQLRKKYRESKRIRDDIRASGEASESQLSEMIRQSQFEKAELNRLKKRIRTHLAPYEKTLNDALRCLKEMKDCRRARSEALQNWLFDNFKVCNALGMSKSLNEIFADTFPGIPPSGAGECCAPKLLHEAYLQHLTPLKIAEYWYGRPKGGEVRQHGVHYPACRGKCRPVLGWMLQGLDVNPPLDSEDDSAFPKEPEILYSDHRFCVISKPSGMLSVPGKGKAVSAEQWVAAQPGIGNFVKAAHRLDRDTSGLLIIALSPESHKTLQSLFATGMVKKKYTSILEGDYMEKGLRKKGEIKLPLAPDLLDRPRQVVDYAKGKEAVTEYEFTGTANGVSMIDFYPLTGRTHQLRVHAASPHGLDMPVAGDPLYGSKRSCRFHRLMLHARRIEFRYPPEGETFCFEAPVPKEFLLS